MTSHRIGVNLRVSGNCDQGGRKYMEDYHAIKFVKKDDRDYEFAYFGIFDGHGGPEASRFARDNLLNEITKYDQFWTDNDEEIQFAIRSGFLDTHQAMWKELDNWPRTVSGLPSTSGTTASIAIVKKGKLYIGHVGDSGIVLGCDEGPRNAVYIKPICLTKDHKPDNPEEKERIEKCGGAVVAKAGVQRVVWSRPKVNHKGPIRRSTQIDKIPFLAVARSLGDLWSYDYYKGQFVVSPDPDVSVMTLDPNRHRCMVLGSDGLWNMLTPAESVSVVTDLEMHFEDRVVHDPLVSVSYWINPAEKLVTRALNKWRSKLMKADNISCIVVLIDPLGPSKLTLLRKRREDHFAKVEREDGEKVNVKKVSQTGIVTTSSSSTLSLQGPTTSSATTKANHNQNNTGGHRVATKGGSDADTENKAQEEEGEAMTTGHAHSTHPLMAGSGNTSSFVGRDITSSANQAAGHNSRGGHDLRSAHRSPPATTRAASKPSSASKAGEVSRAAAFLRQYHIPGRKLVSVAPRLNSSLFPGDLMDDSMQATSVLASLSPRAFSVGVGPTMEEPTFPKATPPGGTGLDLNSMSPVSMSSSLLKLMSLDAVKAQSKPIHKPHVSSSSSAPNLGLTPAIGGGDRMGVEVIDQRRQRRSAHGILQNSTLQHHSASHLSSTSSSGADRHSAIHHPPSSFVNKTFHSERSVNLNNASITHNTRSMDKTFHFTRMRHFISSTSNPAVHHKQQQQQPLAANHSQPSSASKIKDKHTESSSSSKSLRALSVHSTSTNSAKKAKKRRHFGLFSRTRLTLRRARNAACKVLCPENKTFLRHKSISKRKCEEKHTASDTPSTKRLRRSDGHL